jgi:hypothetical protein
MHYLMYVDESGDSNLNLTIRNVPDYFALTGLIIEIDAWRDDYQIYKDLKTHLRSNYGFRVRQELHGHDIVRNKRPYHYLRLNRNVIRAIYSDVITHILLLRNVHIINVFLLKTDPNVVTGIRYFDNNIEELAWNRIATRFDTFLRRKVNANYGLIIPDESRVSLIRRSLRKWRVVNYQRTRSGSLNFPLIRVIEDPLFKDTRDTPFLQFADMVNYSLVMRENVSRNAPGKNRFRKIQGHTLFNVLRPLLLLSATYTDPNGIIRR